MVANQISKVRREEAVDTRAFLVLVVNAKNANSSHVIPSSNPYAPMLFAFFVGLPPFNPFARAAAFLARLRDCPPACPRRAAIHFLDPINPSSSPGIYRSASSFGKCTPKPDGLSSISSSCAGLAFSSPCASCGEKLNVSFELSSTITFPLAGSYRADTA
jgi:hypothetical protein